ncbi:LPS assembly lipoprotein LptE [Oleiagrimonas sp. C23AA]|uniref:LPS-assembly lipoprotein LptE n=1 Tax=Oleiagrimonas sp. C23AA TaxID=2719047 RepID=UPI001980BC37|nr:LPS assembly lipoprotein LptE [Oleiagrimonas sp. C23AA]
MLRRSFALSTLALLTLALGACGFHLRRSAQLPASMARTHLSVNGGGDLTRDLATQLKLAGIDLVDEPGDGIAELKVPVARFSTQTLTVGDYSRVKEFAVRYHVEFVATDAKGNIIVPRQSVNMSREFTYDSRQTIGTETQTEALHRSLQTDMVQAIMLRLQAAAEHPDAARKAQSDQLPTQGADQQSDLGAPGGD